MVKPQVALRRHASLADALDVLMDKGAVVVGEARIGLADVDLMYVGLQLVLGSIDRFEPGQEPVTPTLTLPDQGGGERPLSPALPREGGGGVVSPHPRETGLRSRPREGVASDPYQAVVPGFQDLVPSEEQEQRNVADGVAQLVLSLVELLRQLIERQALRRMEGGRLSEPDVERMGLALMELDAKLAELREIFGFTEEELNLDLGPLGRLLQ
ncbi:MAG TPA: gas vesicle protein GvpJ [Chloroflexota bacterium]